MIAGSTISRARPHSPSRPGSGEEERPASLKDRPGVMQRCRRRGLRSWAGSRRRRDGCVQFDQRLACFGDAHRACGKLAVEADPATTRWIVVHQSHHPVRTGNEVDLHRDGSASGRDVPLEASVATAIPQGLGHRIEQKLSSGDTQDDTGQPRRPERSDPEPGGRTLQERIRMAIESRNLAPGVAIRVPKAPVVVLTATPAFDGNGLAVDVQGALEVCQRNASQCLGLGESFVVQRQGKQEDRRAGPAIGKAPGDCPISGRRRSGKVVLRQRAIPDADVQPFSGERTGLDRYGLLDRRVLRGSTIEVDRPQLTDRSVRTSARAKERVPDPECLRLRWMVGPYKVALVEATRRPRLELRRTYGVLQGAAG